MKGFAAKLWLEHRALSIQTMQIRQYRNSDRDEVVALWRQVGLVKPWNDPWKDIDRKLSVDPRTFLVGEINSELMATMMVGFDGHRGWINYLAVSPAYQRKGYAATLMSRAERLMIETGCPKINLQVRNTNADVLAFYKAIGYSLEEAVSLGKRLIED